MAQWVEHLLCKHEDLCPDLQHHGKNLGMADAPVAPVLVRRGRRMNL